jgi:hypothetical protein
MTPRNKNLIIHRVFLPGLLLLLLNDHFLKYYYSSWLTGKLSDFAGLLIFPLFLAYLFPGQAKSTPLITGLFFIFWKSPWSTPLITLYNKLSPINITRTVDDSDLLALSVLPLSWYLIRNTLRQETSTPQTCKTSKPLLHPLLLILPCSLAFMATSPPLPWKAYHRADGEVPINTSYTIKMSPDQVLEAMRKEGFSPITDTSVHDNSGRRHFILENVVFPAARDTTHYLHTDTIRYIHFSLYPLSNNRTELYVKNFNKKGSDNITDAKMLKLYAKYARYVIKKDVIHELR